MDGVIVDFGGYKEKHNLTSDEVKAKPHAYLEMEPIHGSLEAIDTLIDWGYEVWIATKAPTGLAGVYADKVNWILKHKPELKRRIIITHDKGLLGDSRDFLCDDRPFHANCTEFSGTLLPFVYGFSWEDALTVLSMNKTIYKGEV